MPVEYSYTRSQVRYIYMYAHICEANFTVAASSMIQELDAPVPAAAEENASELERPTEYLRRRCPICFGGTFHHDPSAM